MIPKDRILIIYFHQVTALGYINTNVDETIVQKIAGVCIHTANYVQDFIITTSCSCTFRLQ